MVLPLISLILPLFPQLVLALSWSMLAAVGIYNSPSTLLPEFRWLFHFSTEICPTLVPILPEYSTTSISLHISASIQHKQTTQRTRDISRLCIRMVFWCQRIKIELIYYTFIYNSSKYFPTITRLLSVTRAIQSDWVKMFYVPSEKKGQNMYSLRDIDCVCTNKQIFINTLSKMKTICKKGENVCGEIKHEKCHCTVW